MKLTYWRCECLNDAEAYDIRARTKREAIQQRDEALPGGTRFGEPEKVVLEYADGFDLMDGCLSEGGWRVLQIN